ncbi:MAG: hypothetical protein Q7J85_01950 [Bacillota bacterium]|nr:hypothetical protein [Bacillota bacterium]
MNYFQILSLVFGAVMILTRLAIQFFPKQWNEFELNTAYTERQPKWVWIAALCGLSIIAFTWYIHFTTDGPYSLVIRLIHSLTLIKLSQVLFNYKQFRAFAARVLTKDRKTLSIINTFVLILGAGVILMGIFLY